MKVFILALVAVAALIFAVGSIGAWGSGSISIWRCLIQCAISVIIEWFALKNIEK